MIQLSKILIATQNKGKIEEFKKLLNPLNIEVESLLDYPDLGDIKETGVTFEENARLKAETIAVLTNKIVMADDSGLCVKALNGAPGVYSARFAGEPSDSERNNDKLLDLMKEVDDRSAFFVSCLVCAYPNYPSLVVEGRAYGRILHQRQGERGFGYDPLFYYPQLGKSFAQMSLEEKNKISHRANAFKKLIEALPLWLGELNK